MGAFAIKGKSVNRNIFYSLIIILIGCSSTSTIKPTTAPSKELKPTEFAIYLANSKNKSKRDVLIQNSQSGHAEISVYFGEMVFHNLNRGTKEDHTIQLVEKIIDDLNTYCKEVLGGSSMFERDRNVCFDKEELFSYSISKRITGRKHLSNENLSLKGKYYAEIGYIVINIAESKKKALKTKDISLKFVNTRETASGEIARIHVEISENISEIGDVIFYINGSETYAEELSTHIDQSNNVIRKSYNIKIQQGLNAVKAIAYGKDGGIKSDEAHLKIVGDYELDAKPSLHAIVIGIDSYNDKRMNLNFAEADASLFGTTLYKLTKDIFSSVNILYLRKEHDTTKIEILNALTKFQNISSNDFFIFFCSAHGVVVDDIFYLINSDAQTNSLNSLKLTAINQYELLQLFKRIPTANKLLLFDTCHSGLINTKVSKKLFEYSQKKLNITSISASQTHQLALEGYADGHGVFTYVISDAMEGLADLNGDGIVSSIELVLYANEHVPKTAKKLNHVQIPAYFQAGQIFPITKHRLNQKDAWTVPLYFSENEIEKMVTFLQSGNISSFNKMIIGKKNETDQEIIQIKKEAEKKESLVVENEFKLSQQIFNIDRIKFIFHDDSVFLGITDRIKNHFTFVDDNGHRLLVLDFYSNEFTKHSVNRIDTTKISKIDIGWHNTFYRVTLHLEKLSFYDLKITDSGVYIKIRDR
jgi:hypothetical protein